ncbi:hypothetical protein Tco_0681988 [Tanacetum coccineum]|uniref:Uncharacterized protein n=1 Tax=Tanacetum coccineum TaxID=301880 RepID=A0ABQ4XQ57_9ASTR
MGSMLKVKRHDWIIVKQVVQYTVLFRVHNHFNTLGIESSGPGNYSISSPIGVTILQLRLEKHRSLHHSFLDQNTQPHELEHHSFYIPNQPILLAKVLGSTMIPRELDVKRILTGIETDHHGVRETTMSSIEKDSYLVRECEKEDVTKGKSNSSSWNHKNPCPLDIL